MPEVRIRIATGDTCIEYEGSLAFFERAIAPLMDALAAGAAGTPAASGPEPNWTPASPQHFVQFASQVGARAGTIDQRIMAFAFYLWNFEKQEACTNAQIEAFFRTVREDPPADLDERLAALSGTKRFLAAAGEGTWRLTTKGVNYVKNRLLGAMTA